MKQKQGGDQRLFDNHLVSSFSRAIMSWFADEGRDLPWRRTHDPYKIWISEVILQQTQVIQGLDYYKRFIEHFPNVRTLAEADIEEVLLLWEGLGYYSRAHNLKHAAEDVAQHFGGQFPREVKDIASLKGIGPYTLAAITSIAYGEALPVVDGNVYRVLSRFLGLDIPIDTTPGQKIYREIATTFLDKNDPGTYNQAIMDLGAMVCTPKVPACTVCPVKEWCRSAKDGGWTLRPFKAKKTAVTELFLDYFLILHNDQFVIEQRDRRSIWKGLFQLPLVVSAEADRALEAEEPLLSYAIETTKHKDNEETYHVDHRLTHRLLHIRIHTIFFKGSNEELDDLLGKRYTLHAIDSHREVAMPKPLRHFFDTHFSRH